MSDLIDRQKLKEVVWHMDPATIDGGFYDPKLVARRAVLALIDAQPAAPSPALTREALAAAMNALEIAEVEQDWPGPAKPGGHHPGCAHVGFLIERLSETPAPTSTREENL